MSATTTRTQTAPASVYDAFGDALAELVRHHIRQERRRIAEHIQEAIDDTQRCVRRLNASDNVSLVSRAEKYEGIAVALTMLHGVVENDGVIDFAEESPLAAANATQADDTQPSRSAPPPASDLCACSIGPTCSECNTNG